MISWSFGSDAARDRKLVSGIEPSRFTIRHFASSSYAQTSSAWFACTLRRASPTLIRCTSIFPRNDCSLLLDAEEPVDYGERLGRLLPVGIVTHVLNRHDLHARDRLLEALLRLRRHDGALAAEDVDRRTRDAADMAPQFGDHEALRQLRIPFPDQPSVGAALDRRVHVGAQDFVADAGILLLCLGQHLVLRRPLRVLGALLLHALREPI